MNKLIMKDLDVSGKRVLLRVDYNVPLKQGKISDDTRISASLPTLQELVRRKAKVILLSHLGRPKGEDATLSLAPVAKRLEELVGLPVQFFSGGVGEEAKKRSLSLKEGEILLLENLRFFKGEKKPAEDPAFTEKLGALGDCYINDAFATSHRKEASVYELPKLFHGLAAAGLLMEKELVAFEKILKNPTHPFFALIGGAKISTKLKVLASLLDEVDLLCMGGAMANTCFLAKGLSVGASLVEADFVPEAKKLLTHPKLLLPIDVVLTKEVAPESPHRVMALSENSILPDERIVDIGPKTVELFSSRLQSAKTIFWNGPLGLFEVPPYGEGTKALASALSRFSAEVVVGGGDTVSAINESGFKNSFSHLSTGGGATLELIENRSLPGIDVLTDH